MDGVIGQEFIVWGNELRCVVNNWNVFSSLVAGLREQGS